MTSPSGPELFFLAAGAVFAFLILKAAVHRIRAGDWPLAEGRVAKLQRAAYQGEYRRHQQLLKDDGFRGQHFGSRLEYTFKVDGETYGGYFGQWGFNPINFAEYSKTYSPSSVIFVRYNAKDPQDCEIRLSDNPGLNVYEVHIVTGNVEPQILEYSQSDDARK